jgi:hypothetical protein
MSRVEEAARGIYGAWRLAHGDANGFSFFDTSIAGFWRSFFAMIVALPAYAALVAVGMANHPGEIDWQAVVLVEGIAYVFDWFAFPLAAVYVCQWLNKSERYTRLIVALNWAKVLIALIMLPATVIAAQAPGSVLAIIPVAIFVAVLAYVWNVTRLALGANWGEAMMVTMVNLTLGVVVSLWARSLLL